MGICFKILVDKEELSLIIIHNEDVKIIERGDVVVSQIEKINVEGIIL